MRVNTEARLRALKVGLLIMALLAMLAIIPASSLPHYVPGEVPPPEGNRDKQPAQRNAAAGG